MNSKQTSWRHVLIGTIGLLSIGLHRACAEDELAAPVPHWIWADNSRDGIETAFFLKTFKIEGTVEQATLAGVADFAHVTIYVNGKPIVEAEPYGPRFEKDVLTQVRTGQNILAVRATACDGPSAVALILNIVTDDGKQQTVATDDSWLSSTQERQAENHPDVNLTGWLPATEFGPIADEPWGSANQVAINSLDDYTQWKRALGTDESADPSSFIVPDGFEIALIRSAEQDEGSWVSMAFDPQGRVVIAKEDRGLLRMTLSEDGDDIAEVQLINDTLLECRGLLFAFDSLYANANNSKGLYRLRDTDDDDQFDEVKLLYHSPGSVGHGRNDLALGADNMIYSIHGDAVDVPRDGFHDLTTPFREHRRGVKTREGHVIRTDADGTKWELVTAGLRNPFGIDFNSDGEMFTYDADAEHDMGSPWYRPTRVNHLLPGGDFGWRGVTKQWPPYYPDHPDAAPPTLDIGKGSPTAVKFGYKSNFPPKYRNALFVLDWAYGRVVAVHMTPRGASYGSRAESFARGRPLNVTDLDFGPDGAMYFVTGGRKTKSGLYRIRYVDAEVEKPQPTQQQIARAEHAANSRITRRWLESLHGKQDAETVESAWRYLADPDPTIRHAARIAIEHQPVNSWQERALAEERPTAALVALMSLAASDAKDVIEKIVARLNEMPKENLTVGQTLIALRAYQICLTKQSDLPDSLAPSLIEQLDALYPHQSALVNQELSKLLVQLGAPSVIAKTLELLDRAERQSEQLHYMFVIRDVKVGWTDELRERYFKWFGH
ncbi:MAG: PQQ-dependent sugar dehydrogenase, partial [Planctomycetes bacterium]|nr:PQQ-dependent sugar dehydrogenase [Planctomycetota bacterium]